jgi:hypothetical protein
VPPLECHAFVSCSDTRGSSRVCRAPLRGPVLSRTRGRLSLRRARHGRQTRPYDRARAAHVSGDPEVGPQWSNGPAAAPPSRHAVMPRDRGCAPSHVLLPSRGSRAGRGAFTVRLPGGSPLPGPNVLKLKSNSPFSDAGSRMSRNYERTRDVWTRFTFRGLFKTCCIPLRHVRQ